MKIAPGTNILSAAKAYLECGWQPVPIPERQKAPALKGWQKLRFTESGLQQFFDGKALNIGLLLGEASGNLQDVDIDAKEALAMASDFLPGTPMMHGRKSKPRSHHWFITDKPAKTEKFSDVDGTVLVELRGTGGQTVVPPSVHPSGEPITWEGECDPASVDYVTLRTRVATLAACALVVCHYPNRSRQEAILALSGGLLNEGWSEQDVEKFVVVAARVARDEELDKRAHAARDTAEKVKRGEAVTGWPALNEILGKNVVERLQKYIRIASAGATIADAKRQPGVGTKGKPTQAQLIINLAEEAETFHDEEGNAYVTFPVGNHLETSAVKGRIFRQWLVRRYYKTYDRPPSREPLHSALSLLEARAVFDGDERHVHIRVAELDGAIYLDLANPEWEAVEINPDGWKVVKNPPVRFRRAKGIASLPNPVAGGSTDELRRFLNVASDADFYLIVAWIVAALRPRGPYPVLVLNGEHGSAKSTAVRVVRALCDPNTAPLRAEPREVRDLMIAATNSWCLSFDNVSHLPPWLSDSTCRLATGGGFSTRLLYENDEEIIFNAQRPVTLNGIEEIATRSDLIDRCIVITLPQISDDDRKDEEHFWKAFNEAYPRIFGAFLDAVSAALRRLPEIRLPKKPRMADFALWATAAEPGLGWPAGRFMDLYAGNRSAASDTVLESSPVASEILELGEYEGTAAQLLDRLNDRASEAVRALRGWPKGPRGLAGALRRLAPNLRAAGIDITFSREASAGRRRLIVIKRMADSTVRTAQTVQAAESSDASPKGLDEGAATPDEEVAE